jgi:hypothetical protein
MTECVNVSIEKILIDKMRVWIHEYVGNDPSTLSDNEVVNDFIWRTLHEGG